MKFIFVFLKLSFSFCSYCLRRVRVPTTKMRFAFLFLPSAPYSFVFLLFHFFIIIGGFFGVFY